MKKILAIILSAYLLATNAAFASVEEYSYEWGSDEAEIPLEAIDDTCYLFELDGEQYVYSTLTNTSPIKYNEEEFNFFNSLEGRHCHDYLQVGEYYMIRLHNSDLIPQSHSGYASFPVRLYDKEYTLISEYLFDSYVYEINYLDGVYYCRTDDGWFKSEDFQNWESCENVSIYKAGNVQFVNNTVSVSGSEYYNILYENDRNPTIFRIIGKYVLGTQNGYSYVSYDNIYNLRLDKGYNSTGASAYFYNDCLVYEGASKYFGTQSKNRIYISKNEIDTELESLAAAPYVVYNNTILAFETAPVIENGTTFIPIRFLFEQMGAEVDWDSDTQTASISDDDTVISFSIDDTTAKVNGKSAEMAVPAQFINDKTMVPVRFLSEELGYTVTWDGDNRIITIE